MKLLFLNRILFIFALFYLLFLPFIYSDELYNGVISAKQIWFYEAMALLMISYAIFLIFNYKLVSFNLNLIDIALFFFYIYYLIRATTTSYISLWHNQRFLNWTLCIILYIILKNVIKNEIFIKRKNIEYKSNKNIFYKSYIFLNLISIKSFIIHFLILTALGQSILGILQLYGYFSSFNSYFKITGTFFNPAPYAFYLAIILPIAINNLIVKLSFLKNKNKKIKVNYIIDSISKYLSFITVFTILLILPLTLIRAAWACAIVGILIVSWPWLKKHTRILSMYKIIKSTFKYKIITVMIAILILIMIVIGMYQLKKSSTIGKLLIWEISIGKICEKPIFGYGIGRFEAEYNNWQADYFKRHTDKIEGLEGMVAGNTKYAFNEFIELTTETGILGLLMFLFIIGVIFYSINQKRNKKLKVLNNFYLINSLVFSILILMSISYIFYSLPTLVLFFILLILVSISTKTIWRFYFTSLFKTIILILLFGGSLSLAVYSKNLRKGYYYWDEANKLYNTKSYYESCQSFFKVYNQFQTNGEFLQQYGKALYMNGNYTKSFNEITKATFLISNDILYCTLGDIYKLFKQYDKAELSYIFASNMNPNKQYELFLLTMLYKENNDIEKMVLMAKRILKKKTKIQSHANEEIKREMLQILK